MKGDGSRPDLLPDLHSYEQAPEVKAVAALTSRFPVMMPGTLKTVVKIKLSSLVSCQEFGYSNEKAANETAWLNIRQNVLLIRPKPWTALT